MNPSTAATGAPLRPTRDECVARARLARMYETGTLSLEEELQLDRLNAKIRAWDEWQLRRFYGGRR